MCGTCGCGDGRRPRARGTRRGADAPSTSTIPLPGVVEIETALLAKNDHLAAHNRDWLAERGIVALNLMSSPGSGKTTLLRRTIRELAGTRPVAVIEGDQETRLDAERIRATGAPGRPDQHRRAAATSTPTCWPAGCARCDPPAGLAGLRRERRQPRLPRAFRPRRGGPGRSIISVTEGDDKPLKYPHMFAAADLVVVNKIDLLPYVDVRARHLRRARRRCIRPGVEVLPLSVTTGEGIGAWREWLLTCAPVPDGRPAGRP